MLRIYDPLAATAEGRSPHSPLCTRVPIPPLLPISAAPDDDAFEDAEPHPLRDELRSVSLRIGARCALLQRAQGPSFAAASDNLDSSKVLAHAAVAAEGH